MKKLQSRPGERGFTADRFRLMAPILPDRPRGRFTFLHVCRVIALDSAVSPTSGCATIFPCAERGRESIPALHPPAHSHHAPDRGRASGGRGGVYAAAYLRP